MMISKSVRLFAAAAAFTALPLAAQAQQWPSQPVKVVVPFSAGSITDLIARAVFDDVATRMGQPFVVDNRVGASGTIGANAVAKADDNHTILVNSSSHTVVPATYAKLPYDTVADFVAVTPLGNIPNVLVVKGGTAKTVKDLMSSDKAKKGDMNYGSAGAGSASHLTAERLLLTAKVKAQHVPFKGAPEALREIVADRIDFYFSPLGPAKGMLDGGQLAAIAVSGSQRAVALPNVPTTTEAGFPNSEYDFWVGVLAPAKMAKANVDKLSKEIETSLAKPEVKDRLAKLGADPLKLTAAQFDAKIKKEIQMNTDLVKAAGIKVE